jgi:hypothetical protein
MFPGLPTGRRGILIIFGNPDKVDPIGFPTGTYS